MKDVLRTAEPSANKQSNDSIFWDAAYVKQSPTQANPLLNGDACCQVVVMHFYCWWDYHLCIE
jgi:hypothetical protein